MVEMLVKAAKNCQRCSLMFLDSEQDHRDAKNFAVAITNTGKAGSVKRTLTTPQVTSGVISFGSKGK